MNAKQYTVDNGHDGDASAREIQVAAVADTVRECARMFREDQRAQPVYVACADMLDTIAHHVEFDARFPLRFAWLRGDLWEGWRDEAGIWAEWDTLVGTLDN